MWKKQLVREQRSTSRQGSLGALRNRRVPRLSHVTFRFTSNRQKLALRDASALQVTGNNIANANTPGYVKQRVALTPAPTQLIGRLPLGLGVRVDGILQESDRFLSERLRGTISDLSNSETQEEAYLQLEALVGELTETDLSTSLTNFFSAINDILNQPENIAVHNLAVLQGGTLSQEVRRLDQRVREVRSDINGQIEASAADINRLTAEIAELNIKTIVTEGGSSSGSVAVGLRDQREVALSDLSNLIGVRVVEQPNGAVTVFAGGDFLVFEGEHRQVTTGFSSDRGIHDQHRRDRFAYRRSIGQVGRIVRRSGRHLRRVH